MENLMCIWLIFIVLVCGSNSMPNNIKDGCKYERSEVLCQTEVYCNNIVDIDLFENFRHNYDYNCPAINYHGDLFDRIYLKVKDIFKNPFGIEKELFVYDREYSANIIYSLDFSDNEYSTVPHLTAMINLNILNLSKNALSKAKLSNQYEMESLTEIDYSHNTINEIIVLTEEIPYRKLRLINLSHNYLVAIQDAVFDSFADLEKIDLSYNFIDSLNILTFEGIRNLMILNLKHNRISELNSALLRFSKLRELDLSENKLEKLNFVDYGKLTNLETLDISNNIILQIDKNVFSNTNLLIRLDLSGNLLEVVEKETFANLSNLVDVNLSRNQFKSLPKGLFKDKRISEFSVKDNKLEGSLVKGTFEGLNLVLELDLSNQRLISIEDFAFYGLERLGTLSLNNNRLETLSKKSFSSLLSLQVLDLSNNRLSNIDFDKDNLISLRSFLLDNNYIIQIKHEYFIGCNMLQFLDLSNNNISQLGINSFKSLADLINFQISNNPIKGALEGNTFDGLISLPSLDISNTFLTVVKNSSFYGMTQLKDLNISHSKISELQYNSFAHTGQIETLDISFNELREFYVNTTELINVQNLILNNNLLLTISSNFLRGLPRLMKIVISHNNITMIDNQAFQDQTDIRNLDLSYNKDLQFNVSQLENTQNLASLSLSAIQTNITFKQVKEMRLSYLDMSHSEICNVSVLELKNIKNLNDLVLHHNNINKVDVGAFSGITSLRKLDLSFNKISFIQPGAFKDNVLLDVLNISHNCLAVVSYGIFRGLLYLDTIDMSYNEIKELESERFYEVQSLNVLIVDHNRIDTVSAEEFAGTRLSKLSIGDNPIPCRILVNLKRASFSFAITAIRLDESSDENVDGVTCNMGNSNRIEYRSEKVLQNGSVLFDIRDILKNITLNNYKESINAQRPDDVKLLTNFSSEIEKINTNLNSTVSSTNMLLQKISSTFAEGNTNTNLLLDKIFKLLNAINTIRRSNPIPVLQENATSEGLITYINKIKQDLEETIAIEKQSILREVDNKISSLNTPVSPSALTHEMYPTKEDSNSKSFIFIEICVASILVILVVFVLYKFYNSGVFVFNRHSISTRNLSDAMENSAL